MNFDCYRQLFSADRRESLSFSYTSENSDGIEFLQDIGCKFIVSNPRLAGIMGIEATNPEEARKSYFDALDAGNHVFGIDAGDHSGYWFHVVAGLAHPDPWDGFRGLNFIVVDKVQFQRTYPRSTYCRKFVLKTVRSMESYIQNSINGYLTEVYYQGEDESYGLGIFDDDSEASQEAKAEFPHIKFGKDDFEIIGYRLKAGIARFFSLTLTGTQPREGPVSVFFWRLLWQKSH